MRCVPLSQVRSLGSPSRQLRKRVEHLRDRIGNLTLRDAPANYKAGTDPYLEKRDKYYENHPDYAMTAQLANDYDSEWSLDNIRDRSREIADIADDIWWF